MKKVLAVVLALAMVFCFAACGKKEEESKTVKFGMVCIGNPGLAYDSNFINAANAAAEALKAEGYDIEWIFKHDTKEDAALVKTANEELVEAGCVAIFDNSYGFEPYMLEVAAENPEVQFVGMTNCVGAFDDLDNTSNAFARIYEARYLAGVAAGMKLKELGETKLGYVGAFTFAEVISGYTAFYLGAKSVCPEATMDVYFVGSWSDAEKEAQAAETLITQNGCKVISQHSDNVTPATTAERLGVFHVGYNKDMTSEAAKASIISARIDWTEYFKYALKRVADGGKLDPDYCHGLAEGEVTLTNLNEAIAAPGTAEAIEKAKANLLDGTVKLFNMNEVTVGGEHKTEAYARDTDGDFAPDTDMCITPEGIFEESKYQSAPYFAFQIDGINLVN
jgi:basic membrane protein A